jgi:hypothetical protein
MIEKVRQALQSIIARFEAGDIPEAIAYSTFPIPNIPAANLSLTRPSCLLPAPGMPGPSDNGWERINT